MWLRRGLWPGEQLDEQLLVLLEVGHGMCVVALGDQTLLMVWRCWASWGPLAGELLVTQEIRREGKGLPGMVLPGKGRPSHLASVLLGGLSKPGGGRLARPGQERLPAMACLPTHC